MQSSLRSLVTAWRSEAVRLRLGSGGNEEIARLCEYHANELAELLEAVAQKTVDDCYDAEIVAEGVVHRIFQRRVAGGSESPIASDNAS